MNLSQINKRLLIYIGIVVVVVSITIIVLLIMTGGGKMSYSQIEGRLKDGAMNYYDDHKDLLPQTNGQKVTVTAYDLEQGKYIRPLQKMVKGNAVCSAKVDVIKNGDNYLYTPLLNCGSDYNSSYLYEKITGENNIVTIGDGLYKMNEEFVYRGEIVNNYIKFADKVWRIIKVDKNNDIKILAEDSKETTTWDDRYNLERSSNSGINDYKVSRMKDYLSNMYNNTNYLSDTDKAFVVYKDICIGKRKNDSSVNDNSVECAKALESQPISLLQVNEFLNASIDKNCKKTSDLQCQNYNYLSSFIKSWWSLTGDASNTYKVYRITSSGIGLVSASSYSFVRPVIYLSGATRYAGGTGTADDPYIVK